MTATLAECPTSPRGDLVRVKAVVEDEEPAYTVAAASFVHPDVLTADAREQARVDDADRLLKRTNRMLRWYRALGRRAEVAELTRAQASPFYFDIEGTQSDADAWTVPLRYSDSGPASKPRPIGAMLTDFRKGLAGGGDPEVDVLFLLDAERAVQQGRFREAVLFCWSTIDSVFNRKYDLLANAALNSEWGPARDFFTGHDFGLRNKMSAGMHFVAGRSLFDEPGQFWERMSTSYTKRNKIIHEGENATEDDAISALGVARWMVAVMQSIPTPPPPPRLAGD